MAGMTLYTPPGFWRSYPVLIAAEYSDVPLRVVSEGPEFCPETGRATPYFLSRFPHGKVPVLVADSGFCVQESNAAAYYVSSDVLRGSSPQESALIQQWIHFAESELIPPVVAWVFPTLGIRKSNKPVTERAKEDVKKALLLLNGHLHTRTYLVGEHITLADITLVCAMLGLYKQVLEPSLREQYADVTCWFTTCVTQPPFQRVLGEVTFHEPAGQSPARKPLEARADQDTASEAAGVETCLVAAPKDDGSSEEEFGPAETGLCKDMATVEVHMVASSVEDEPAGEAASEIGVVEPLKDKPANIACLIDASQEELSVVCASMEDRTNEVRFLLASTVGRTPQGDRICVFMEAIGPKEEAISVVLVDLSEEAVCMTGAAKEHGAAKEEAVVGVQVMGVSEETKSIEAFNQLAPTVDDSTVQGAAAVGVLSFLGEDRPSQLEVSLVEYLKEGSVAEVCKAGAFEEERMTDVHKWCRGTEGMATVEVQMVGASGKGSSVDPKGVNASKPEAPSDEEVTIMGPSEDGLASEEAMGEVCVARSLKEATAVALSTLDPSGNDLAGKPKATSAVGASEEDRHTTVDVGLLETSKEEIRIVDASPEHGSVVESVVDAPKGDQMTKSGTVDASKVATEETIEASGECGDDWDPTESADRLKAKDPFACLPKSIFLDEFKWKYSNEDIRSVALPYFWDHFDQEGWSVWYMEYKYPRERRLVFMSTNLITGMFQRLDGLRKHGFASVILFGTDGKSSISGIWILRGQQLPSELSEDWRVACEMYSWKKLDVDTDECKTMVNEYFAMEGTFRHVGKPFNRGKIFK